MRIDKLRINNLKINTEDSLEETTDSIEKPDVVNAMANSEEPKETMELNPIDKANAIQIINSRPDVADMNSLQPIEKIIEINNTLDDSREAMDENTIASDNLLKEYNIENEDLNYEFKKGILNHYAEKYDFKIYKLSNEDEEENKDVAKQVIEEEKSALSNHINGQGWVTLETDFNSINELIKASIAALKGSDGKVNAVIDRLKQLEIQPVELDLSQHIFTIGNLRYFIRENNKKFSLEELLIGLTYILDISSPSYTDKDNLLLRNLSTYNKENILELMNYIETSMYRDNINLLLVTKAENKGNKHGRDVVYTTLTGHSRLRYFEVDNGRMLKSNYSVPDDSAIFELKEIKNKPELLKKEIIRSLTNFEKSFTSVFNMYNSKLATLSSYVKPIVLSMGNAKEKELVELTTGLLTYIRSYYIDFIKDRITDKIMAFNALIDICNLLVDKIDPNNKPKPTQPTKEKENTMENKEDETASEKSDNENKEENTEDTKE